MVEPIEVSERLKVRPVPAPILRFRAHAPRVDPVREHQHGGFVKLLIGVALVQGGEGREGDGLVPVEVYVHPRADPGIDWNGRGRSGRAWVSGQVVAPDEEVRQTERPREQENTQRVE